MSKSFEAVHKKTMNRQFDVSEDEPMDRQFEVSEHEFLTWDDTPVSYKDVKDAWKRSTIKNIPSMVGVSAAATVSLGTLFALGGAAAGSTGGPIGTVAGAIAGATVAKQTSLFIASKVIPGIMAGADFLDYMFKADNPREFHLTEPEEDPTSNMSDFDKGIVKSMTAGFVNPEGDDNFSRNAGEMVGSVGRDILAISGVPVPLLSKIGQEVATTVMFNASMGVAEGFEKYNEVRVMPSEKEDAIKLGLAEGIGTFVGGNLGFVLMPRILTKISSKLINGGISGLNPIHGGVTFGGFDTASKITSDSIVSAFEASEGREITDDYKLTAGSVASSVGGGMLFTGAMWGPGKLLSALGRAGSKRMKNSLSKRMKNEALAMADEIKAKNTRVTYDGKIMQEMEQDMPQMVVNSTVDKVEKAISSGKTSKEAIREEFEKLPGEYLTHKNIISILEYFSNVK